MLFYHFIKHRFKLYRVLILILPLIFSCKKFVEIDPPPNLVVDDIVFSDDNTATGAVTGIYSEMMSNPTQFSSSGTTFYAGMSADELYFYVPGVRDEFTKNQITQLTHTILAFNFWERPYRLIYTANLSLEGLAGSTRLLPETRDRLIGECKFLRAFCFFHLVNLFGDVPLTTTSDYRINAVMPRTAASLVNNQILSDLLDAQRLLPESYPNTGERIRVNKWAATAMLARFYTYQRNWAAAEAMATAVINSQVYSLPNNLDNVFLKASNEAIWQLLPVNPLHNTLEGNQILQASPVFAPTYLLTPTLVNAFETGDQRKANWAASRVFGGDTLYYPFKYKVRTGGAPLIEYYMVLRLAEQYLIRAEANAQQNKLIQAAEDINSIRNRAGLDNTPAATQAELLLAIEQERRVELFAEWGHRWYDLKRTDRATPVLGPLKGITWNDTDVLWPIPSSQILANPALKQNPGY